MRTRPVSPAPVGFCAALFLLTALLLLPPLAGAQIARPLPTTPTFTPEQVRLHVLRGRFTGTVTVDPNGRGDYSDLSDALTFVTAQTRSQALRWLVLVYPGQQTGATGANLTEATVTIPSWTSIQGVVGISANGSLYSPTIRVTGTSGNLVTFGAGASLEDVTLLMSANVTAAAVLANAPTGVSTIYMRNVGLIGSSGDGFALDLLSVAGDTALFCDGCYLAKLGAGTLTRHVVTAGTSSVTLTGGRLVPGTSQAKAVETTSTSTLRLQGTRIDTGFTVDLTNTGGTLTEAFSTYTTSAGTIGKADGHFAKLHATPQTPASAAAACDPGQIAGDTGFLYFCPASGTWLRVAIATW